VTDRMNLTGGYRFTDESKSFLFDHSLPVAGIPGSGFFKIDEAALTESTLHDWRAVLDYQWTDNLFTYFQASTGHRSGGFNPRPFSPAQLTDYGPEKGLSYELGVKADTFGNRLRTNIALWMTDYTDRIITQQILDNDGLPFTGPINLGTAIFKGFEIEATFVPVESFNIYANYGFIDMQLDPDPGACPGFIDLACTVPEGSISPGIPEHTFSAGAEYVAELGNAGRLATRLDYAYRSRVFGDNRNDPLASVDPWSILSARMTWTAPGDQWSVALSFTNLTDEEYFINKFTLLPFGLGTLEGQPARPMEWAISVRRDF
jgi:iron complex outermembrane receptor protein